MSFPKSVSEEVLLRCRRHCCLCDKYAGTKIELHHIRQVADGGDDTVDNCIPLCLDCHAEVNSYNLHHPKGKKFTEVELKGHRDWCYAKYDIKRSAANDTSDAELPSIKSFQNKKTIQETMITWGFSSVDKICTLKHGTIALVAGYTNSGKSIYAQQIMMKNIAMLNNVV